MKSLFTNFLWVKNEKGQAIVFGAFFAVALMILGGLTVDTAFVFLRKAQLQRAIDASAMAGITRYWTGVINETEIESSAAEMARYNLRQTGVADAQITQINTNLTVDANQVATLVILGTLTVPTFFMRILPGPNLDTVTVNATGSSRRIPAVLSLVLDTSGSMNCNGSCNSKFTALKTAANTFVDSFENNLDRMAIVRFSDNATVPRPMSLVNKTQLHTVINGLSASGWTNIPEAVTQGRLQIESANNPDAVKVIVLFTDGAPNTFRAYFTNARNPLTKNYPTVNPVYWDYSLFPAESPITVKHPTTLAVKCTGQAAANVSNCFNSLTYRDSRFNIRAGSANISRTSQAMRKEAYHLAVVETDYAKSDGITIYTIGLGDLATENSDVYQTVDDDQNIKSYLLRRIANDPAGQDDPQFPGLANPGSHPSGIYFQTPNPSDLTSLFEAVARRIKLRLIE